MAFGRWFFTVLLLQFCCTDHGFCGKVLVWPADMSHWLNMKTILQKLTERGHEVTVLVSSVSYIIDYHKPSTFNFQVIPMENIKENATEIMNDFLHLAVNIMPTLPLWKSAVKLHEFVAHVTNIFKLQCENVAYNKAVMKKLHETKYDVMVIDPVIPCGELIAELLAIPFIYTLRFSMGHTLEKNCGKLPVPLSYVPIPMTALKDKMTFMERAKNMVFSVASDFWIKQYDDEVWDKLYSEVLGKKFFPFKEIIKRVFVPGKS